MGNISIYCYYFDYNVYVYKSLDSKQNFSASHIYNYMIKKSLSQQYIRHSIQEVYLSQRIQTSVQIVSKDPAPSNGGPIFCFWASQPCVPAGWMLLIKAGDVETNVLDVEMTTIRVALENASETRDKITIHTYSLTAVNILSKRKLDLNTITRVIRDAASKLTQRPTIN